MPAFAVPQALWLLLALPLIILLHMLRARRVPHTVSSTLLWERTTRDLVVRLPVRRLERSLLLLLQLLAVTLLALALARPVVSIPGVAGDALVLVFDTSRSMQAYDAGEREPLGRFAAARQAALRLVEGAAGLPVMVLEAGAAPRVVLDFTADPAMVRRAILRLAPGDGRCDLEAAVRAAVAQRLRGRAPQVVVYTDTPGPRLPRVTYRTFGRPSENLALVRMAASTSGTGRPVLLTAVRNFGSTDRRTTVHVAWPDGTENTAPLLVPAGEVAVRVWPVRGEGVARVRLEARDVLPADDRGEVVVGRAALPRVLLVSPGNPFLEAALQVLPVRAVGRAARPDPAAWPAYDVVVLDRVDVRTLPPGRYLIAGSVPETLPLDVEAPTPGVSVLRTVPTHPLLRMADLTGIRTEEALTLRPRGGTVLAEGSVPLLWVLERPELRVVLLPFDLLRSDLPAHPAFPILMANILEWLAPLPTVEAGTTAVLPAAAAPASLVDPSGRVLPVMARGGVLALPRLDRAGVYVLRTGSREQPIAVVAPPQESDLRQVGPSLGQAADGEVRQQELWWVLLLLALGVLLAEGVLWLRSRPPWPRRRPPLRHELPVLRLLALGLLLLALAGLEIARGGADLAVVFALDLSDSVPVAERQRALDLARTAVAERGPGHRFGLVIFGAEATIAEGLTDLPRLAPGARPPGHRTDIGAAIRTALGLLPPSGARRIVLMSDGRDTAGSASEAAALAATAGVDVAVVPLGAGAAVDARIDTLQTPAEVRSGERFEVRVWVETSEPAPGVFRLFLGGRQVWQEVVRLPPGRSLLRVPQQAADPGALIYEARLEVAPDDLVENNRGFAVVQVVGVPAVVYAAREPGPLLRWLRAQGLEVRETLPEALPADAAAYAGTPVVVLDDVPATVLSPAQMRALREYVSVLGGGLVVAGGPHTFGPGGYAATDLEATLPLSMDVRHRVAIPSVAVVLVIDASGSMGSFGPEIAKVELAKEAAQSVIDLLGDRDLIGVVAFDQAPHWLARPTEARQREQILGQVSRITAGGGTNLYPALLEAEQVLRQVQAKVKHVIVLSDGQTDPGDFQRLVARMAREKITLSSVAVGNDADQEFMRDLAAWGRGRYYFTRDLYTIPQIVTAEAVLATRAYLIEEQFRPLISPASPLLRGLAPPPLGGYVATAPKPSATLHALTPQQDPLLASWQFGLGRVVAFTSDARPRWAARWLSWPDVAIFWSRLVRWAVAPPSGELEVQAQVEGDVVHVVLDARDRAGTLLTDLEARAQVVGRGAPASLEQTAPGRYEGRLMVEGPGGYLVTVEARRQGRLVGVGRTPVAVSSPPELAAPGAGGGVLSRLVEAAGARVVATPAEILAPPSGGGKRRVPAWPPLAGAALGLFLAEVTLRRLPVIREVGGRGVAAVLAWLRQAPPPPGDADREYEAADQWLLARGQPEASEDMERAARLYIARLRQLQESDRSKERR
ncbi:MAG: VWA domain-containing protein [Armatimonadota bacterium]|nr:VWA domain-containing protein [Armatimonadota bacterium]